MVVVRPDHVPEGRLAAVRNYLENGGGLVMAATGWGWEQVHRRPIREFSGNALLAGTGLAWTGGFAEKTTEAGYSTSGGIPEATNASAVLDALGGGKQPEEADIPTALESVRLTLGSLPPGPVASKFGSQASQALASLSGRKLDLVPTRRNPASGRDRLRRFAIGIEAALAESAPVDQVRAIAAAADFPGLPDGKARPASRSATIDTRVRGWHSLGLYAAPGARINVKVGPEDVPLGLSVQIGCHTDELWHLDRWERLPQIVRRFPIDGTTTVAANALGGLVYIDVPDGSSPPRSVNVRIEGAVDAPLFRLGSTSKEEWRKDLRNRPGPWAELAGKDLIFTVPSSLIRGLDDPEPLMAWWDAAVRSQAAFARTSKLERPERIVCDRQISAGYMHSGYPIMAPIDDSARLALDLARLRAEGTWGHLHEIGHNFQGDDWTFDGTGEVTNNLQVVHTFDTLLKLPYDAGHEAIRGKAMRTERIRKHLAAGAPFDEWKADPFLALMMYIQLYEGFGWAPFDRVFAEYEKLARGEHPRSDDDKRDQWLIRMSKAAGRNLGPFFRAWGVPTSQAARDAIGGLPAWMPEEMKGLKP
ncbi:hypothetical protein OJF2_48070 [Aquisphaera giovannonii]|uniref:Peptidase M60 domain-containing protein n=1 Tax=Aquisphaera giovannonii TaxID=406548 RepID=A0A5B9W7C2_9BACT|nr:M60 family metallopeptidase [Aquisphaera giovannonii]QEH36247.1 hypothetical protein OJF2_48070 [Aquisphaera giovannonii]